MLDRGETSRCSCNSERDIASGDAVGCGVIATGIISGATMVLETFTESRRPSNERRRPRLEFVDPVVSRFGIEGTTTGTHSLSAKQNTIKKRSIESNCMLPGLLTGDDAAGSETSTSSKNSTIGARTLGAKIVPAGSTSLSLSESETGSASQCQHNE